MSNDICIGIIGNYFGHLSGAENVAEHPLPNGIFVINRQHEETLTAGHHIKYPFSGSDVDIEPEFVIRFKVSYCENKVVDLSPIAMTIGNDFTIRTLAGSMKIAERKAWGEKSKGIHDKWWLMRDFTPENYGHEMQLVSYIERSDEMHCATPLVTCADTKVFCTELIDWMIEQINNQPDEGIYEEILPSLVQAGFPEELVLFTGAPNYSKWGEDNFIQPGDKVHIAAFKADRWQLSDVEGLFASGTLMNTPDILTFSQQII